MIKRRSWRNRISVTVFFILSILLLPVTLLGYVIWVGKGILTGRSSGVSMTAKDWFLHAGSSTIWAPGKTSLQIG
jgi:hypothetical protein